MQSCSVIWRRRPFLPIRSAAALDVVAHEYAHGIFEVVAGIIEYSGITGAIEEGYADIFACLVQGDWIMGENLYANSDGGLRNIKDPPKTGNPDRVGGTNYVKPTDLKNDNGGVHDNSTIISHAAYLMEQKGLTKDDLAKIWYKSMQLGYSNKSTWLTVRSNVKKAAKQVQKGLSKTLWETLRIIDEAFTKVSISSEQPRIVLTWGRNPEDLDSHLVGPLADSPGATFHVDWTEEEYIYEWINAKGIKKHEVYVSLDWDDRESYGPETVTHLSKNIWNIPFQRTQL